MNTQTVDQNTVTVVVSRRVRQGKEATFEAVSERLTQAAATFPGYLGASLFRPASADDPEYRIVFKFGTPEHLENWQESEERLHIIREFDDLLEAPSSMETLPGIVPWFTLPSQTLVQPPPKYKMTLVSWLALYPTVTLIFWVFAEPLAQIPLVLRTLLVTAVVMVAMTYLLMPRFTRWFRFWLYPRKNADR